MSTTLSATHTTPWTATSTAAALSQPPTDDGHGQSGVRLADNLDDALGSETRAVDIVDTVDPVDPVDVAPTGDSARRTTPTVGWSAITSLFADLYQQYHADVYHYLLHQVHDATLADDLAQEVFLHTLTARRSVLEIDDPHAWLFRIAQRLVIDHFRWVTMRDRVAPETPLHLLTAAHQHHSNHQGAREGGVALDGFPMRVCEPPDTCAAVNPEAHLDQVALAELIRAALSRLPLPQQRALLLYHGGDASYDEIAAALHSRPSGVKMVLSRARRAFRAHYQELLYAARTTVPHGAVEEAETGRDRPRQAETGRDSIGDV